MFMYLLTNKKHGWDLIFVYDPTCCCLGDYGHGVI